MIFAVKVKTGSKSNQIKFLNSQQAQALNLDISYSSIVLEINVKSRPVKNKANEELIDLMSKYFKVPKHKVDILSGSNSKIKKIKISDICSSIPLYNN